MIINHRKLADWLGLGGAAPTDIEIALYISDYIENLEDKINGVDAAVLREAARRLLQYRPREGEV